MRRLLWTGILSGAALCLQIRAGVVLVDEAGPRFTIVTAASPTDSVKDAVAELNYWMVRISGGALPVATDVEWGGKGGYIAIGPSSVTKANGWDSGSFRQEEARVFIEQDRIGLLGNDLSPYTGVAWTGSYYAVLEFVRRSLHVRWIWPGESGEVFDLRKTVVVDPAVWSWAPDITVIRAMRNGYNTSLGRLTARLMKQYFSVDIQTTAWMELGVLQDRWLKRERMNESSNIKFGHAFSKWWDLYSKDHPDWFARPPEGLVQRGGIGVKLNLSNPEVQEKIFSDWKTAWDSDPAGNRYLNLAPNDSRGFDTRPETRAWDAPAMRALSDKEIFNGSDAVLTDRYIKFWNMLARRIKNVDAEAKVATYAYRNYRKPPLGDEQIEDNMIVAYVGGEGYYPDENYITEEWQGWAKKGAHLSWRPNLLNGGHGIPYLFSRRLYDDFKTLREYNMLGSDFDSLVGNWSGQGLVYYVLAEQHSRPDASYETLSEEYFTAFGPAANVIRDYHVFFEKETTRRGPALMRLPGIVSHETWGGWWRGHIRIVPLFMTPDVVKTGSRLLADAELAVREADPVFRERVALLRTGFTHACLMADVFRRLHLDDPAAKVSYSKAREILQPLWDFRQGLQADLSVPAARYTMEEQRQFGIWAAFLSASPENGARAREVVSALDAGWSIKVDPGDRGRRDQWQASVRGKDWNPVAVGVPWRRALVSLPESKIAWYRVSFQVPDLADTGERVRLRFSSVDAEVKLWVNNMLLGERGYPHNGNYDSWSEAFEIDVTKGVRPGSQNEVIMRVESGQANGGITGPVVLVIGE